MSRFSKEKVAEIYNADPEREWGRLSRTPFHTLEFTTTMYYLDQYLGPASLILDAGGGPGRYSIALCRKGHRVVLLDLSDALVARAQEQLRSEPPEVQEGVLSCEVGDIRNLHRFPRGHFDAVLCLGGPLSHVADPVERCEAVSELIRVAKPGGLVAVSAMGYLAMLRTVAERASFELADPRYVRLLRTGDTLMRGTVTHFFRASELKELLESNGAVTLATVGCEGLSSNMADATNRLAEDPAKWSRWLEIHRATADESSVADLSEHILCIGRKK